MFPVTAKFVFVDPVAVPESSAVCSPIMGEPLTVAVARVPEASIHPFRELSRSWSSLGVHRPDSDAAAEEGKAFATSVA